MLLSKSNSMHLEIKFGIDFQRLYEYLAMFSMLSSLCFLRLNKSLLHILFSKI